MDVNTYIIEHHSAKGNLRKLAAFIFFKNIYVNNTFYKFNYTNTCKKTGLGRHVVKTSIDFFIKEGWCDYIGDKLYFKRLDDTVEEQIKRYSLKHDVNGSINAIYYQLVALLFKRKKEQHDWLWKTRNNDRKMFRDQWGQLPSVYETFDFFLSYTRAGSLLGRSATTAYRVLKEMEKIGLAQIRKKTLGFLKRAMWAIREGLVQMPNLKHATLFVKGVGTMPVFRMRPKSTNPVDYNLYCFPNAYSFENVGK